MPRPALAVLAAFAVLTGIAQAQDAVPDHALGAAAWPGLPADERAMIEAVAREVWAETGAPRARYEALPEPRKAALRGTAMRRLGLRPRDLSKGWV